MLRVEDLVVEFPAGGGHYVRAVSGVSFDVSEGETLGLVGESGCGKSTTVEAIMRLVRPDSGTIKLRGVDIGELSGAALRGLRPTFQVIFQDPGSSVNPRRRVRRVVEEPLRIWGRSSRDSWTRRVDTILEAVGLDPGIVGRQWPGALSGGQLQRVCIARALVMRPDLLICDEAVSALDVSIQAQILNLLQDLKDRYRLTLVFVTHDLAVVKSFCDRVAVMYLGKLCEVGEVESVFTRPAHPYTRALLESVPRMDPERNGIRAPLGGEVPSAVDPPSGCRFRLRCPHATEVCAKEEPIMRPVGSDQFVACHHANEMMPKDGRAVRMDGSVRPTVSGEPIEYGGLGLSPANR